MTRGSRSFALDNAPFAKHINDVITLPALLIVYTPTPHYEKVSCREEMELHLTIFLCADRYSAIKYSIICNDPRYQDWFTHFWKTKDAIVLRVLSNTSWSGYQCRRKWCNTII